MEPALGSLDAVNLHDWTPVRLRSMTGEIDWALVGEPLTQPFFEQSADRAMQHPFNLAFSRRTPLAQLDAIVADAPGLAPAGLIFHMSRCGSTLIAHMLAQLSAAVVLSEPQPLDALLRLRRRGVDDATVIGWLRAMTSALARPRNGEERLFIKFHAWHVLELPFIARAFPGVPWLFVFREPRAVLRSQARNAGAEFIAGTIDPAYVVIRDATELASPDYGARVVASFCRAALEHRGVGRGLFVDYAALPGAVAERIAAFFGLSLSAADVRRMDQAVPVDTKASVTETSRSLTQTEEASIGQFAATWLDASYDALRAFAVTG
jgi:hypothetical protein